MVAVELAGGVMVIGGHVGQGLVTVTECTATNLTFEQVGQSLVMVSVEPGGANVAVVFDAVVVEPDPGIVTGGHVGQGLYTVAVEFAAGILIGGQVGQGLYSVSVEPDPGIVIGGQVGHDLYTVVAEPDPVIVTGGHVGQGLYTVVLALDPEIVVIGQVGQGLMTVVETLSTGATWPEGTCTYGLTGDVWFLKGCGTNGTPVER